MKLTDCSNQQMCLKENSLERKASYFYKEAICEMAIEGYHRFSILECRYF